MVGFSCPGLGFLDQKGRQVGCLYHPARHGGVDKRLATGYQPKCARETCPEARAFALLEAPERRRLVELCAGLDAFAFSSRHNPARRLLAFGPAVAGPALGLPPASLEELARWTWLERAQPAWGYLLGLLAREQGAGVLREDGLEARLADRVEDIGRALGPVPPTLQGQPINELCDEWEARFWRRASGRAQARPDQLERWRRLTG